MSAPDPQAIVAWEQWLRIKVQFPLKQQQAKERQREKLAELDRLQVVREGVVR